MGNGQEALDAVKNRRFDIILMDVQMPIMGGFEATAKIREYERENNLSRTPIIALTAHAMLGDREKCIQAQMDEYLSKPLKQNQMIQTILKCATLGGNFMEKSKESRLAGPDGHLAPVTTHQQRPGLEGRAITTAGPITTETDSPDTEAGEPEVDRVSYTSHLSID